MDITLVLSLEELQSVTFSLSNYVNFLREHAEALPPQARVSVNEEMKRVSGVLMQIAEKATEKGKE
jgi:hypothetical protein